MTRTVRLVAERFWFESGKQALSLHHQCYTQEDLCPAETMSNLPQYVANSFRLLETLDPAPLTPNHTYETTLSGNLL